MTDKISYFQLEIKSRFSDVSIENKTDDSFLVKNTIDSGKVVEVLVDRDDPHRCSAKYKKLVIKRNGDRYIKTTESTRMVIDGLLWVIDQVKPEFE